MNLVINSLTLVALVLLPAVGFAVAAHFLELSIQRQLAGRFGWRSILWTGWLGTPIHELSHAVFCWLFGHRIEEIRLFDPDIATGRLGFVRHSYRRGHWFEELGNVFIGTAPLLGGSAMLCLFFVLFYPQVARDLFQQTEVHQAESWRELLVGIGSSWLVFWQGVFRWENWLTPRLWLFLYLTLCVASHIAPSRSDYVGAARGAVMAVGGLWVGALAWMYWAADPWQAALNVFQILVPLVLLGTLALGLCGLMWILVSLLVKLPRM